MSVDPPEVSERFRRKLGATFTFLSDEEGELLDKLNVRHRGRLTGKDLAFPTAVLVDRHGIVRWIYEAEFGHMRMTPQDLFEAMERLALEEQNRQLLRGRAVSKVVRQVFLMKKPGDLAKAMDVMQEELRGLGIGFSVCGIAVVDPEEEQVTTFSSSPVLTHEEMTIDRVPELANLVDAWREKSVSFQRFEVEPCSDSLCRMMAPAGDVSKTGRVDWLVNVPFSHGTVFVGGRRTDEPSNDDVRTLTEFADAISVAYQRFVDFRELEVRNQKIQEAQLQLIQSEKMASLGQLVAGVAHELNTPMGAIHSNTQTARAAIERVQEILDTDGPLGASKIENVLRAAKTLRELNVVNESASRRMVEIVGNLRRFARLDESEWKTADLREGLEETLALVKHQTRDRITITKDYAEIPPVACYPGQLNQVFMNLIINAIQAIEDRGNIHIETRHQDGEVSVRIADDGHGIPRDRLDRIFDPGFTTKGVGVGTGLGLSICYQIVKNHGGELTVTSEPGQGSVFTVSLPLDASPKRAAEATLAPYSRAR